jgi:hypothetical protein
MEPPAHPQPGAICPADELEDDASAAAKPKPKPPPKLPEGWDADLAAIATAGGTVVAVASGYVSRAMGELAADAHGVADKAAQVAKAARTYAANAEGPASGGAPYRAGARAGLSAAEAGELTAAAAESEASAGLLAGGVATEATLAFNVAAGGVVGASLGLGYLMLKHGFEYHVVSDIVEPGEEVPAAAPNPGEGH